MDARTSRFTDRVASLFEHDGLPPIAGRIFALLLLSEEAQPRPAQRRAGREQGQREHQHQAAGPVRPDRAGPPARQPARLLPDRGRSLRAIHGGAARSLAGVHRCDRRGAAHPAAPDPEVRERLERYEGALSYMADAIGRAMVQRRAVPARRLARTGSGR